MSTSFDASLTERELVGEERRLERRGLGVARAFADLYRLLGHSAGDSKSARIRDLAEALEVGESTIQNTLLRLKPFGETLLTAMYGEEPCGQLHPDWVAEPENWGPITPWVADAPAAGTPVETVPPAAPEPAAAQEPEAAIPPPPATIPPEAVPLAQAVAELAAVSPPPAIVFTDLQMQLHPAAAGDSIVNADAIAEAVAPVIASPIAAAIDLLRDQRELTELRLKYCEAKVSEATAAFDAAEAAVMKITAAIEVLEGLDA